MLTRVPTPDSTYYPIPYYGALFRGKWYNIKQLIGMAKEAKLKNIAPIKYQIEISNKYWDSIFKSEGITDRREQQKRIVKEKQQILDFLTGVENAGKVWFSTFYVAPTGEVQHEVVINKIDSDKEGGDWSTDIQEAVNMICFTMRVYVSPCAFTATWWAACPGSRRATTRAATSANCTPSPRPCRSRITTCCSQSTRSSYASTAGRVPIPTAPSSSSQRWTSIRMQNR